MSVRQAVRSQPLEMQVKLYNNVVPCGGCSMLPWFVERFALDLKRLENRLAPHINIHHNLDREYSAWYGANKIARLDSDFFESVMVTRAMYHEKGEAIFREKQMSTETMKRKPRPPKDRFEDDK